MAGRPCAPGRPRQPTSSSRSAARAFHSQITAPNTRGFAQPLTRLEDIDWVDGTITLVGTKGRPADALPLPAATGGAIADYLREERPRTLSRAIFVRHVAPYDEPLKPSVVNRVVVQAYRRCGWTRTKVHILRHTMASRLLRTGEPMKDEGYR